MTRKELPNRSRKLCECLCTICLNTAWILQKHLAWSGANTIYVYYMYVCMYVCVYTYIFIWVYVACNPFSMGQEGLPLPVKIYIHTCVLPRKAGRMIICQHWHASRSVAQISWPLTKYICGFFRSEVSIVIAPLNSDSVTLQEHWLPFGWFVTGACRILCIVWLIIL